MPDHVMRRIWPEKRKHDFATDEGLERKGGEHIEAEAETGDLDGDVGGGGEVVEDVAGGERAEGEEAGE